MPFIEVTARNGEKVSLNVDAVSLISERDKGSEVELINGRKIEIEESYDQVIDALGGRLVPKAKA